MNRGVGNYITKSVLTEIKNNQTAVVRSVECGETMVIINNPLKAYGVESHILQEVHDTEKICRLCKKAGFPNEIVWLSTNSIGETYITMECADSLPVAICVKEIDGHLKLCKVIVKYNEADKKNEMSL